MVRYQGHFCLFGGPMQDAVWGPIFCQTTMDRLFTLLGDPQRCNNQKQIRTKNTACNVL